MTLIELLETVGDSIVRAYVKGYAAGVKGALSPADDEEKLNGLLGSAPALPLTEAQLEFLGRYNVWVTCKGTDVFIRVGFLQPSTAGHFVTELKKLA